MVDPVRYEQVALSRLIENAYDGFEKNLLSTSSRVVLWGSFSDADQLARQFLEAGGRKLLEGQGRLHLLDRRRKAAPGDESFLEQVEAAAADAFDYLAWVRERQSQPIWHEILVGYCSAFENCLKTVGIAFRLARESQVDGLKRQISVPGQELNGARRATEKEWKHAANKESPRVKAFFEQAIRAQNPSEDCYRFPELDEMKWDICSSAFQLRNAIVHSQARPFVQVELGSRTFHAGDEIELNVTDLSLVASTFKEILRPLSPQACLDDLLVLKF